MQSPKTSGRGQSPKSSGRVGKADAGTPKSPDASKSVSAKATTPKEDDDMPFEKEDEEDKHSEGSKDSEEKKKIAAAKKAKKNQISRRERLKKCGKCLIIFLKWFVVESFAVLTCHYRGRKRNYRRNHWVKIPDRPGRQLDLRIKREDWCESQLHEWRHQVESGKLRTLQMMYRTWRMSYENSRDDTRNYIREKLRLNHRKTGLPKSLLEWFHFQELVHQGPHGYVYKAEDLFHRTVAIKLRDKSKGNMARMPFRRARKTLKRQVVDGHIPILKVLRRVLARISCGLVRSTFSHPHIAEVFTVWENYEYYVEVCEWLPGHSLQEYTEKRDHRMDEHHVCETFTKILTAVDYMHSRRLIHRDIRINQIMMPLTKDEDQDPAVEEVLIPDIANVKLSEGWCLMKLPRRGHCVDTPLAGDMATRAPEVMMHNDWSTKADVWSAGCLLFELLYGHLPFGGEDDALVHRVLHDDPEFDMICGHVSDEALDLVRQMLARKPFNRPSAKQALQHAWFSKFLAERDRNMRRTEEHLIRDVRLDGTVPQARRGMNASNLLVATTGMLNSGFCTFMGSTRCDMDFLIGGEGAREDHHYWVGSICVSLWATEDNPKTITVYASSRPNTTWAEIAKYEVANEGATEARIILDKPVRYLRLGLVGNFGGVLGIALRKVSFYGYQIRQLPILLELKKAGFARGCEIHVHNDQMAGEEVRACPKFLVPFLEKGARIPGTGQRHMVYRDVDSGPPHVQTVMALHMPIGANLPKGLHIIAAALQLRSCNVLHSGSIAPKLRVTIDDGQPTGRQFVCATSELRPSAWPADQILSKGYEDAPVCYAENLNLITDEGLVLELNFENNGGHIHIPVDFGFVLYYVPELDSDDSDYEEEKKQFDKEHKAAEKKIKQRKESGLDMNEIVAKNDDEDPAHWSDHEQSELNEQQLEGDLKEMREVCKYGAWGTGNALQKEVDDWLPRDEDIRAIEAAQTPQERRALQEMDPKPQWWEAGQETESEPDSWGTQSSTPQDADPKRSARKSAKKLSGFGDHAMTRVSKHDADMDMDEEFSEESIKLEGVDERGFMVDANETKEDKYERLLSLPPEELTKVENAFIRGIEREHEAVRMAADKRARAAHEKMRKDAENKARAQAESRRDTSYKTLVHVRPDLMEDYDPDELRKMANEKYELRYAPDGTKRMVRVKGEGGILWECTAACREDTDGPSPCCESTMDAINECAPAVLNPFTPPPPPSSPRKTDMRAAGAQKGTPKGCVLM